MKRFAILAFALIAFGPAAALAGANVAAPDHIVVFDVPNDFAATATALGFTKVEPFAMQAVKISGYRLGVPRNATAAAMIGALKTRYPSATVDTETTDDFALAN